MWTAAWTEVTVARYRLKIIVTRRYIFSSVARCRPNTRQGKQEYEGGMQNSAPRVLASRVIRSRGTEHTRGYFPREKKESVERGRRRRRGKKVGKKNETFVDDQRLLASYSSANRAWHIYFRSGFCPEARSARSWWQTFRVNFNPWFLLDPPSRPRSSSLPPSSLSLSLSLSSSSTTIPGKW